MLPKKEGLVFEQRSQTLPMNSHLLRMDITHTHTHNIMIKICSSSKEWVLEEKGTGCSTGKWVKYEAALKMEAHERLYSLHYRRWETQIHWNY